MKIQIQVQHKHLFFIRANYGSPTYICLYFCYLYSDIYFFILSYIYTIKNIISEKAMLINYRKGNSYEILEIYILLMEY